MRQLTSCQSPPPSVALTSPPAGQSTFPKFGRISCNSTVYSRNSEWPISSVMMVRTPSPPTARRGAGPTLKSDEERAMLYKNIDVDGLNIFYREAGNCVAEARAAARLSGVLAPVSQSDPGAGATLPRDRAGLSGLRQLRHARSCELRLHLRQDVRDHRGVSGQDRVHPLRTLRSGLRRPGRLPHRHAAAGLVGMADHPEHQRLRSRLHPGWDGLRGAYWKTRSPRPKSRSKRSCKRTTVKLVYTHGHADPR